MPRGQGVCKRLGAYSWPRCGPSHDSKVPKSVEKSDPVHKSVTMRGMRVSAKTDYALRALLEMSSRTDGKPVSAEELGRLQDIPHGFLQAILADLRKAGVVIAQRGQSGGWRMNRDPGDVSVADVIRAVDGPLVSVYGVRPEAVSYNEKAEVLQLRLDRRPQLAA